MNLRRQGRLKFVEPADPRTIPVQKTGLWHGALMEIKRLDAENARLKAELEARTDRLADLRSEYTRGEI